MSKDQEFFINVNIVAHVPINAVDLVISLDSLKKESQGSTISELSTTQASLDNNNSEESDYSKLYA